MAKAAEETKAMDAMNTEEEKIVVTRTELQQMVKSLIAEEKSKETAANEDQDTEEKKLSDEVSKKANEKVRITIPFDSGKKPADIPVCINGKVYLISKDMLGEEMEVPRKVAEVLQNSIRQRKSTNIMIGDLENEYEKNAQQ